jgi:hypothetical protein
MFRITLFIFFIVLHKDIYSQHINGRYIYTDGAKYNVAESIDFFGDSTYKYYSDTGLTRGYSYGKWKLKEDTIYLTSEYLSSIKSFRFESKDSKCIYFEKKYDSGWFNTIFINIYFKDGSRMHTGLDINNSTSVIGEICENMDNIQRELLEYRIRNIEKKEKIYYDYLNIDSIVFIQDDKKIGLLESDEIVGNMIHIDLISENFIIFKNEKLLLKNNRTIYRLDDNNKKIRRLRKKRLLTRGVANAG